MASSTTVSLYDTLGISRSASSEEIKAAYRKLARRWHPDVVSIKQKEVSAKEFIKIHSAYSTLSDPLQRANYDTLLYSNPTSFPSSNFRSTAATAYTSRWETDQCW